MADDIELSAYLEADSAARLMRFVKNTNPALAKSLRARLRLAAVETIAQIQRTLREPTPEGTDLVEGGVRDTLAANTKLSIRTGVRTYGIRIVTSGTKLEKVNAAMLSAYNKKTWRHPSINPDGPWIEEQGRPYFGSVIVANTEAFQVAAALALDDAAAAIRL